MTSGTIIPRELGVLGRATRDSNTLMIEGIAACQGERVAADAAAGCADAYADFCRRHPDAFD